MRLRLKVQRHQLPCAEILFHVPSAKATYLVSKLLEDVNDLLPLESADWGLEDYIVELGGYECLHYQNVLDILRDDDEVSIRVIETTDYKARSTSGRYQIAPNGAHLIDGVPFGRSAVKRPARPTTYIPPRKRPRLLQSPADGASSRPAPASHSPRQLRITSVFEDADAEPGETEEDDDDDTIIHHQTPATHNQEFIHGDEQGVLRNGKRRRSSVHFDEASIISQPGFTIYEDNLSDDDEEADDDYVPDDESEEAESADSWAGDENIAPIGLGLQTEGMGVDQSTRILDGYVAKNLDPGDSTSESSETSSESDSSSSDSSSESSSSDSSSDSSSSDSEEDESDSEVSVTPETLPKQSSDSGNSKETIEVKPAAEEKQRQNPPGTGTKVTRARNERRKRAVRLRYARIHGFNASVEAHAEHKANQEKQNQDTHHLDSADASATLPTTDGSNGVSAVREENMSHKVPDDPIENTEKNLLPLNVSDDAVSSNEAKILDATENDESSTSKRRKTAGGAARRMIFASLGHRNPRSKADEERIKTALGQLTSNVSQSRSTNQEQDADDIPPPRKNWSEKIHLNAIECYEDDVTLKTPPFPFRQYWDSRWKSKKRQRSHTYYGGNEEEQQEDSAVYDENYIVENGNYDEAQDPDTEISKIDQDDLPELPDDIESLPSLQHTDCKPGSIITFKQMEVSAANRWEPTISNYRTARIDSFDDATSYLSLTLAARDIPTKQHEYDADGQRIYQKFEIPEDDEDEFAASHPELRFEDLIDAKLLAASPGVTVAVEDSQFVDAAAMSLTQTTNGVDENSLQRLSTDMASDSQFQPAQGPPGTFSVAEGVESLE